MNNKRMLRKVLSNNNIVIRFCCTFDVIRFVFFIYLFVPSNIDIDEMSTRISQQSMCVQAAFVVRNRMALTNRLTFIVH